jgi:hypothetical protein
LGKKTQQKLRSDVSPNGVGGDFATGIQAATLPVQEFNTRGNERSRSLNLGGISAEFRRFVEMRGLNERFLVVFLFF